MRNFKSFAAGVLIYGIIATMAFFVAFAEGAMKIPS